VRGTTLAQAWRRARFLAVVERMTTARDRHCKRHLVASEGRVDEARDRRLREGGRPSIAIQRAWLPDPAATSGIGHAFA